jgi:hypothetical protein
MQKQPRETTKGQFRLILDENDLCQLAVMLQIHEKLALKFCAVKCTY